MNRGILVILLMLVGACGGPFPAPRVAKATGPAAGLHMLVIVDNFWNVHCEDDGFVLHLKQALREAGLVIVESSQRPYDVALAYMPWSDCETRRWEIETVGRDGTGDIARRQQAVAFQSFDKGANTRVGVPGEYSDLHDSLLPSCFVDAHAKRPAVRINNTDIDMSGKASDAKAAAYWFVDTLVACPQFERLARVVAESGLSASSHMESLPTDKLVSVCAFAQWWHTWNDEKVPPVPAPPGTGAMAAFDDACDLAKQRGPDGLAGLASIQRERALYEAKWKASMQHNQQFLIFPRPRGQFHYAAVLA